MSEKKEFNEEKMNKVILAMDKALKDKRTGRSFKNNRRRRNNMS